jgi:monomeric isocitrate dehydrogenase
MKHLYWRLTYLLYKHLQQLNRNNHLEDISLARILANFPEFLTEEQEETVVRTWK